MRHRRVLGCVGLLVFSLATGLFAGCSDRGEVPTTSGNQAGDDPVGFSTDVQPIFTRSCATSGCHRPPNPIAGLDLSSGSSYANIVGVTAGGNPSLSLIRAGRPDSSLIHLKLTAQGTSLMPPSGALPTVDIETVRLWIEEGAADN